MNLRNKTRAELESCTPNIVDQSSRMWGLRCLDSFTLWALKSDISLTPSLLNHGYWEAWITSWFTRNVHEGDFVVDIGANCGYYTMLFERLVGPTGQVVAYECNPEYARALSLTQLQNQANFKVVKCAVDDTEGHTLLTFPGDYTGSATITKDEGDWNPNFGAVSSVPVETVTLDGEFEGMPSPTLVKIDAEGAEERIFDGGSELFHRADAPVIVMEYTPGAYSEEFDDRLFEYGEVTRIGTDGKEHLITRHHLRNLTDWEMIVIRKHW